MRDVFYTETIDTIAALRSHGVLSVAEVCRQVVCHKSGPSPFLMPETIGRQVLRDLCKMGAVLRQRRGRLTVYALNTEAFGTLPTSCIPDRPAGHIYTGVHHPRGSRVMLWTAGVDLLSGVGLVSTGTDPFMSASVYVGGSPESYKRAEDTAADARRHGFEVPAIERGQWGPVGKAIAHEPDAAKLAQWIADRAFRALRGLIK